MKQTAAFVARWIPLILVAAGLVLAATARTQALLALGIVLLFAGLLVWLEERLLLGRDPHRPMAR